MHLHVLASSHSRASSRSPRRAGRGNPTLLLALCLLDRLKHQHRFHNGRYPVGLHRHDVLYDGDDCDCDCDLLGRCRNVNPVGNLADRRAGHLVDHLVGVGRDRFADHLVGVGRDRFAGDRFVGVGHDRFVDGRCAGDSGDDLQKRSSRAFLHAQRARVPTLTTVHRQCQ